MSWLAWGAMILCAVRVARVAGLRSPALVAVIIVSLAIVGPTWFGRLTTGFWQAVLLTGLVSAVGAALLARYAPLVASEGSTTTNGGPTPWMLRLPVAIMTVGVIWTAAGGYFWDEHSSHYAFTAVTARGVFPPQHPLFPGEPLRYHFGFDVLAAHARSMTSVPVDVAIDVATVIAFLLLLATARHVGRHLGGPVGGGLTMLLAPLGGGALAFLLFNDMGSIELHWDALPVRWQSSTPPPVISNFFQHPQGLGMSFALATIAIWTRAMDSHPARRARLALGAFVLGTLALVHVVFFAVLGLALGATVVFLSIADRRYRAGLESLGALLAALGIGYSLGGFFAPGPPLDQVLKWGTSFFQGGLASIVAQHFVLFGLPLVTLPFAVVAAVRHRSPMALVMAAAALIGFTVPNLVTYTRSWDIVKFLGIGTFFANVLFAWRLGVWSQGRWGIQGAVTAAAVVLATNTAWIWLARSSVLDGRLGIPKMHFPPSSRAGHALALAVGPLIPPHERVLTQDVEVGRAGGFLTPGFNWRQHGIGFMLDRERAETWYRLKGPAMRSLDPAALAALDVRWLVFRDVDLQRLTPVGRRRLDDESFSRPVAKVGQGTDRRHVYRLLRPLASTAR